ncbi:putative polyketide synthase, partial [Emericellopsis cladophorae]
NAPREPIAIVGSSCRFAGDATSPSKLWELLKEPRDVQSRIPDTRFCAEGFYHQSHAHHRHCNMKHAYLLNQDPAAFDAEFFGISAIESKAIDPQQRMLLEIVYEALEDAGMDMEALRGSDTAVFAGLMCAEYEAILLRDLDNVPTYYASGTSRAILSNRISYLFDWHGASITVDTACSSSLVAVHQAVQALRSGESRIAVACGANLILGSEPFIVESKVKILSPDGRSRMWDKEANDYARGDGIAALVLKPFSQAIQDGDAIHCLVRETGVCQDGATAGITMPSATAQRAPIHNTFRRAGLDPHAAADCPQYFEAHRTGTPAGDPIEAEAIRTAFFSEGSALADGHPLYVGSIKTVLGHTEGTAGIAGILKAAWA